jgi:AraC-like DNA-binding protein
MLNLVDLAAGASLFRDEAGNCLAAQARDLISGRFRDPIRSTDLAAELNVHPVYLARVFRRRFGVSMHRYVRRLRVRRAAEMLADDGQSVAAIAIELGFADQAHFCRSFREELNTTPSAYRRLALM